MRKIIFQISLAVFLFTAFFATAQTDSVKTYTVDKVVNCNKNVDWTYETKKVSADEYDIIFTANIAKGWHLYGTKEVTDQIPVPTKFTFNKSNDVQLVGDLTESTPAQVKYDSTSQMKLYLFENKATFTQRIKLLNPMTLFNADVFFMLCNVRMCMPPCNTYFNIAFVK